MKFKPDCSQCFAGLSCGARLQIVNLLREEKKLSVSEISSHFKLSQPTITHHLHYLKTAGIVKSEKQGRNVFYQLNPKCGWGDCTIFI